MNILLIDNGTTLLSKLRKLIPGQESVTCFDNFDSKQALQRDLIVLSGSNIGPLYENEDEYKTEIDFIKTTQQPIIGICFGCELIIQAFGGTLKELPQQEQGEVVIKVLRDEQLFEHKSSFSAYENHRWGADRLPSDFEVLAESEHGPEVFRHKQRPIYGLQFHPENHVDTTFGDEFFLNIFSNLTRQKR